MSHPGDDDIHQRYRIERELGRGGMAIVHLATDVRHSRKVALKTLREPVSSAIAAERFLREIALTAQLDHPHIVPLLDSGESSDGLFYVMPYVEGETLRDRLSREKQLPLDDALGIAREVLDALEYAHARGVMHRDIKPENILLAGGHARVVDFGIARAIVASGGDTLTQTGMVLGTPLYMSPEQAAGDRDLDRRSDLYALACVLYEMLAGQPPFTGPTLENLLHQHLVVTPRSVTDLRPAVPAAVAQVLGRALAKVPADRFASAAQFAEALAVAGSQRTTAPALAPAAATTPTGPTQSLPRRRRLAMFAVAASLLLGTAYGVMRWRERSSPAERPLVAVLPFRNMGAPADEYFADGITEEITSRLGRISAIGVISRTTASRYKGTTLSLREIAGELGVKYVLEGTIRTEHLADGTGRVRVTPDLIRASDDTHLWTDSYTAGLAPGDVFGLQARIAEQVAEAFHVSLLNPERDAIRRVETADSAAYRAYLLGRFLLGQGTTDALRESIAHFEDATARDPRYARAYAGLADAYVSLPYYPDSWLPDSIAFTRAADAVRRSIALDATAAESHSSLGLILAEGQWDWDGAEREQRQAIALDRDYANAYSRLSSVLAALGRTDEALEAARRAVALGPTDVQFRIGLASRLAAMGRLEEGDVELREAARLQPQAYGPRVGLAEYAALRGDLKAMADQLALLVFPPSLSPAMRDFADNPARKPALLRAIEEIASQNVSLDEARKGWLYANIGETGRSLDALERAVAQRSPPGVSVVLMTSTRRALSREPRYQALMARIGYKLGDSAPKR